MPAGEVSIFYKIERSTIMNIQHLGRSVNNDPQRQRDVAILRRAMEAYRVRANLEKVLADYQKYNGSARRGS